MEYRESTFDELVKKISTDEARKMLDSIRENVDAASYNFGGTSSVGDSAFSLSLRVRTNVSQEPFFVRLFLYIVAFFRSVPVQTAHNEYLLRHLARELKRIAKDYYSVETNCFTEEFFKSLSELRRTQLFFYGLLQAYDSDKGEFYILLSSFVAPNIYENLLKKTDPFTQSVGTDSVVNTRANASREIDTILGQLTESQKAELYTCAKAIEWIKNLCDASVDKALLKFSGAENGRTCPGATILSEMQILTSVLASARQIPNAVLQTLFLLYNQENIAIRDDEFEAESAKFKSDAADALKSINRFISVIPMTPILRYVGKDIAWQPIKIEAGEDWFVFFKHAWKERLSKKWDAFAAEQEKTKIREEMFAILETKDLVPLAYEPWKDIKLKYDFSRKFSFEFIKTLFITTVPYIVQVLNVIAMNGKFVRRENGTEFLEALSQLRQFPDFISSFETMLSPSGEVGSGFEKLKSEKLVGLTFKKNLDTLLKSVETNAWQVGESCTKIFSSLYAVLTGVLSGNKKGLYATLSNFDTVNANKTEDFMQELQKVYKKISDVLTVMEKIKKIG